LLIKAKLQHGKNENKNTGLLINCMDFVVVRRGFFSRGPLADLKKKKRSGPNRKLPEIKLI
jgi:hypothetical protein